MGTGQLGQHLEETGQLKEAAHVYDKMRQDINVTKHIIDCSQQIISIALQRKDWQTILGSTAKVSAIVGPGEEPNLHPYLKIVGGLAMLGQSMYSFHLDLLNGRLR